MNVGKLLIYCLLCSSHCFKCINVLIHSWPIFNKWTHIFKWWMIYIYPKNTLYGLEPAQERKGTSSKAGMLWFRHWEPYTHGKKMGFVVTLRRYRWPQESKHSSACSPHLQIVSCRSRTHARSSRAPRRGAARGFIRRTSVSLSDRAQQLSHLRKLSVTHSAEGLASPSQSPTVALHWGVFTQHHLN